MDPVAFPKSLGCFPPNFLTSTLKRRRPRPPKSSFKPLLTPKHSRNDEFREVFRHFDSDDDGMISATELRSYFSSIGVCMSDEEARVVIADFDSDGDTLMDFGDFLRMMEKEDKDEDLKTAFEMFEVEKGSGRINPESLRRVLSRLGNPRSYGECAAMIQVFDNDGSGELDYDEFHQMMMAK